MAELIGRDGMYLMKCIYAGVAPEHLCLIPAVDTLRQVWIQHFYLEENRLRWREQKNFPPSSLMIASPYDLEVQYSQKRGKEWRGYKVHLTETCEPDRPNLITHVARAIVFVDGMADTDVIGVLVSSCSGAALTRRRMRSPRRSRGRLAARSDKADAQDQQSDREHHRTHVGEIDESVGLRGSGAQHREEERGGQQDGRRRNERPDEPFQPVRQLRFIHVSQRQQR